MSEAPSPSPKPETRALALLRRAALGRVRRHRRLLTSLPFPAGYGAALSLLFNAARAAGIHALAQVRLSPRPKPRVPLADLGEAAYATFTAATARTHGDEDLDERAPGPLFLPLNRRFESRRVAVEERPPLDSL